MPPIQNRNTSSSDVDEAFLNLGIEVLAILFKAADSDEPIKDVFQRCRDHIQEQHALTIIKGMAEQRARERANEPEFIQLEIPFKSTEHES